MISKEEIQNLAELSRLKLSEREIAALQKDFDSILEYVGQISAVQPGDTDSLRRRLESPSEGVASEIRSPAALINVMRDDEPRADADPMAGKAEAILSQAPKREGDYFAVRKIIDRD